MFGFFIAGVSLLGLIFLNRRRRGFKYSGYWFFRQLDTSPAQEQVIRTALYDFKSLASELKEKNREGRHELAQVFSSRDWDESALDRWLSNRKLDLEGSKPRLFGIIKQVHEVLDPEQRAKVARWIEKGPRLCGARLHRHAC